MEAEVTAAAVVAIVEVAAAVVIAVFPVVVSHFCGLSFCWFSVLSEGLHTYPTLSSCYFFPPVLSEGLETDPTLSSCWFFVISEVLNTDSTPSYTLTHLISQATE